MEEQLKTLFTEIVQFAKTVSPEIWAILVKQQFIWAISGFVLIVIGWISFYISHSTWQKTKENYQGYDLNPWGVASLVIIICIGVGMIVYMVEGLPRLLNPE